MSDRQRTLTSRHRASGQQIDERVDVRDAAGRRQGRRMHLSVAAYTLAVSLGTSLVVGLAPAWQASRGDLQTALQPGDRGSSGAGTRVRAALVFVEIALSTVLLTTAVLLRRSFQRVQAVDPGFRPSQVLTIRLSLARARYAGCAAIEHFANQVHPESLRSPAFAPWRPPTSSR